MRQEVPESQACLWPGRPTETQGSREGLQRPLLAGRVSVLPGKEGAGEEAGVPAFKLHAKLGPGWDITQAPAPASMPLVTGKQPVSL